MRPLLSILHHNMALIYASYDKLLIYWYQILLSF